MRNLHLVAKTSISNTPQTLDHSVDSGEEYDPEEKDAVVELRDIDKLTMKKKLRKLDRLISRQTEFRVPLAPDGTVYKEDHKED